VTNFHIWVAKAIADCGGNADQYLRGIQEEWLLTFTETRMDACQGVFDEYFQFDFSGFMRDSTIVPTNFRVLH